MSFWKDLYGRVFSLSDKDCKNRSVRPEDRNQSAVAGKKRKARAVDAKRLIQAVEGSNISTVRALAEQGMDVNAIVSGSTALRVAAGQCDLAMVRALLALGADPCLATSDPSGLTEDAFSTAWTAAVHQSDSGFAVLGELVGTVSVLPKTVPTLELDNNLYLGIFRANGMEEIPHWVGVALAVRCLQRVYPIFSELSACSDLVVQICSTFEQMVPTLKDAATNAKIPDGFNKVSEQITKMLNAAQASFDKHSNPEAQQEVHLRACAEVKAATMLLAATNCVLFTDSSGATEALASIASAGATVIGSTRMALGKTNSRIEPAIPPCVSRDVRQAKAIMLKSGWSSDQALPPRMLGSLWQVPAPEGLPEHPWYEDDKEGNDIVSK